MSRATVIAAAVALAAAFGAGWGVQGWRLGAKDAERLRVESAAKAVQDREAEAQREFNQTRAGLHAAALAGLNTQLGDARAHIATLSRTQRCLGADTLGVLNHIGKPSAGDVRAPAGQPDGAPAATAGSAADGAGAAGYASEHDTAEHIAICRARYAELSSQVNQILDIEERRHAGPAGQ